MGNKQRHHQQQQHHHHHEVTEGDHCVNTPPDPNATGVDPVEPLAPPPAQPPTQPPTQTPSDSGDPAASVGAVKSDLHQCAEDAKAAWWQVSATGRADLQKLIHDIEAAENVSLASVKRILGF